MIGPGTGIAPFRAFLHHRRAHGLTGRSWLFFGDRNAHCDFLYRTELESFLRGRELSRLDTAFSRDQPEKVYVQQRILESGRELWSWLQDGAMIFVCGDASRMAKDVDAALRSVFVAHGRRSEAQAQLELREFAAMGRYVRDVY
jgi:sulfite reductase (NADPH) flavoprotein alpha-component